MICEAAGTAASLFSVSGSDFCYKKLEKAIDETGLEWFTYGNGTV
jgi:hypothetical protein